LIFFLQTVSETLLILRGSERDVMNVRRSSSEVATILIRC